MDGHIDLAFDCKFIPHTPRRHHHRPLDPYALEPWEKNTLEPDPSQHKKYKTFYPSPTSRALGDRQDKNYSTHRVFSFRKDSDFPTASQQRLRRQSLRDRSSIASEKSVITHYNINGNFLGEDCSSDKRTFSNQFFLRAKEKRERSRGRGERGKEEGALGVASIEDIKRRLNFKREVSWMEDNKFVRLNSENDLGASSMLSAVPPHPPVTVRRKSKVISLGFHKLSVPRAMVKQSSLNLESYVGF